ncbi:MAG: hypothetical protein PHP28_06585 [Actinomycetota bacterium]|nr:hypothetical protein [Actinomycetota bacterium]MDD5667416.1 hypothetical protein [Actinomycetota bacterium]
MEEIFYEDILDTFIFCFVASAGLIQIMVARRGWHGLSVYGGRLRPAANYVLGAALVVVAYAWYFSDPLHRNVRNIEAFMSMACLVLGILAAVAATALLASSAESLRRRFGRGKRGRTGVPGRELERFSFPGGSALASALWGARGENLVVLAEPGRGSENLARSIYASLPGGCGMLSLHPARTIPDPGSRPPGEAEASLLEMLEQARRDRGLDLRGETFMGLGWGGNALDALAREVGDAYRPRGLLLVAPVVPDCEHGFAGDALLSNTPLDVAETLSAGRPWRESDFVRLVRTWLPVLAACVVLATAVTVGFDVRWKLFSGPMVGLLLSLWVTYFLARRKAGDGRGWEERTVSRLCSPAGGEGGVPLTLVFTSGGADGPATKPSRPGPAHLVLWEDVLRGKFILDGGTPGRLSALIWEETPGDEE